LKEALRMFTRMSFAAAALLAAAAATPAAAQSYNFDLGGGYFDGTAATITSQNGFNVTFTSSQDANGGFYVGNNSGLFSTLGAQVLVDPGTGGDTLTLTFSQAITNLNFNFGIADLLGLNGDDTLTVSDGLVNTTFGGTLPNGDLFPQGAAAFYDAAGFTTVTITGPEEFVIGLTDVPEPASIAALGMGLLGLAAVRRRRA
jgi:hypothetical protein